MHLFKLLPVFLIAGLSVACQPTSAPDQVNQAIVVQGQAALSATPDKLELVFLVESREKTIASAKAAVDNASADFQHQLDKLGLLSSEIQSYQLTVMPLYETEGDPMNQLAGYAVTREFNISLNDWSNFDPIVEQSANIPLVRLQSVDVSVSNSKQIYQQALAAAVQDATEKATVIAQASERKLGLVISVIEQSSYQMFAEKQRFSAANFASSAGQTSITARVEARYQF